MNIRAIKLLQTTALIVAGLWFLSSMYGYLSREEIGRNVAEVPWLPSTASNVSYYISYSYTAYEFDIPEAGFRSWAFSNVSEISEPVSIDRYKRYADDLPIETTNPTEEEIQAFLAARDSQTATIKNGLYFGQEHESGGGGAWGAYDRSLGRAFFFSAPR